MQKPAAPVAPVLPVVPAVKPAAPVAKPAAPAKPKGHAYLTLDKLRKRIAVRAQLFPEVQMPSFGAHKPKPKPTPSPPQNPASGSLLKWCPSVYDQGDLGSCTANAFCHAYKIMCNKLQNKDVGWDPSRLWVYYWERVLENPGVNPATIDDTGADVVDAETYVKRNGMCAEGLFPYIIANFDNTPSRAAVVDALKHKIKGSSLLPLNASLTNNIETLINGGHPVLMGFAVYDSFESDAVARSGMVPMPQPNEQLLGGHEVCIVGYDRQKQRFTVMNSWGPGWGDHGFCYMPYAYITNPNWCFEFTIIDV